MTMYHIQRVQQRKLVDVGGEWIQSGSDDQWNNIGIQHSQSNDK